jgi:uncharacterized protein (TIGR03435 family)
VRAALQISIAFGMLCGAPWCQTTERSAFEAASVKPSSAIVGHDGDVRSDPSRFTARNATLKRLVFEAWDMPYSRIEGGPGWIDSTEFDIDATTEHPASRDDLKLMLRTLLADRFRLTSHRESRDLRVLALTVAKGGAKLTRPQDGDLAADSKPGTLHFRSNLGEFASRLAILLTAPLSNNPATPSRASGPPEPVLDKTGLAGVFDFTIKLNPDAEADTFTVWQRALQEQLGLRLESQKASVEYLVIDHAEKPSPN